MMTGISLAIIAKDEVDQIERIARDYGQYFDEIVVAWDTKKIPAIKNVRFVSYEWCDDFAHKRNFLAEQIKTDYYFRLDTDDHIINPDNISGLIAKAKANNVDCIYFPYIYSRDEDGNVIAQHWRETIIRKSDNIYWMKPIHENIHVVDQDNFKGVKESSVKILHECDQDHHEKSFQRNIKILIDEYNRDKENTDPRTLAYLGRMLMGVGEWEKAAKFLEMLVTKSNWSDDKYFAYTEIGFCYTRTKNYQRAISACFEAMEINPEYPDAYICLGELYIEQKNFEKAKAWLTQAVSKKTPDTLHITDPSRYTVRLAISLSASYLGCGDIEKAYEFYKKAKAIAPSNDWIKQHGNLFEEAKQNDKYLKSLLWMLAYTKEKEYKKCKTLVEAVPKNMLQDERIQKIRHSMLPSRTWSERSICIFCGNGFEQWADPSVISGLGGSEEAVVYLSRELVKLGWDVTVFNNCGDFEGEYRGVKYEPFYNFNPNDNYNILIGWRGNIFKAADLKAKYKYIWMHDVPGSDQFKKDEIKLFDKIIVLSEYHKSLFPDHVPREKLFVSSNGINLPDFKLNGALRNPRRMIYASSYDRGIQHLLLRWNEVKKAVPDSELHLFYGWDMYDRMAERGFRDWSFKEKMVELMKQDGVFEHGRVGHRKLIKEFQKSGLFVYPCHFQEISCITAMKAQANGCIPVVTGYAALNETVKDGVVVKGTAEDKKVMDKYINALINNLKDQEDMENLRNHVLEHREEFGWDKVARQWHEELFNGSIYESGSADRIHATTDRHQRAPAIHE